MARYALLDGDLGVADWHATHAVELVAQSSSVASDVFSVAGEAARANGDLRRAWELHLRAGRSGGLTRSASAETEILVSVVEGLAGVRVELGDVQGVALLLGSAAAHRPDSGGRLQAETDRVLALADSARAALGASDFEARWNEGALLAPDASFAAAEKLQPPPVGKHVNNGGRAHSRLQGDPCPQRRDPPSDTTHWDAAQELEVPDAEPGSMHDPRNSTALRQLADIGRAPEPSRWSWAIARLEPTGRFVLPLDARVALGVPAGDRTPVRGVCHRDALVVQAQGAGAAMVIDSRGRLLVPAWLRTGTADAVVVGTRTEPALIVVAAPTVLDVVGDLLAGERR